MKSKKIYGVLLIIVLLISKVFAVESYNTSNANSRVELAKIVFRNEIEKEVEEKTYFEFVKKTIPDKFVKPFYDFTCDNKKLGIELLGTAKHESGWIKFEGPANANGTRDYGPLMLNSANLESEDFMDSFASNCSQYKNDRDIYYMCICINFYKSIRSEYGPWSALQIYNGGWRTVRKSCPENLKKTVVRYANKVYSYINSYESEYKEFSSSYSDIYLNCIALEYSSKINRSLFELSLFYSMIKNNDVVFDVGNGYTRIILIDRTCIFDEEAFELFVLGKCIPENVLILLTPEDLYLSEDEEYFERMLC